MSKFDNWTDDKLKRWIKICRLSLECKEVIELGQTKKQKRSRRGEIPENALTVGATE